MNVKKVSTPGICRPGARCSCRWWVVIRRSAELCASLEAEPLHRSEDGRHLSPRYRAALAVNRAASDAECNRGGQHWREIQRIRGWRASTPTIEQEASPGTGR